MFGREYSSSASSSATAFAGGRTGLYSVSVSLQVKWPWPANVKNCTDYYNKAPWRAGIIGTVTVTVNAGEPAILAHGLNPNPCWSLLATGATAHASQKR